MVALASTAAIWILQSASSDRFYEDEIRKTVFVTMDKIDEGTRAAIAASIAMEFKALPEDDKTRQTAFLLIRGRLRHAKEVLTSLPTIGAERVSEYCGTVGQLTALYTERQANRQSIPDSTIHATGRQIKIVFAHMIETALEKVADGIQKQVALELFRNEEKDELTHSIGTTRVGPLTTAQLSRIFSAVDVAAAALNFGIVERDCLELISAYRQAWLDVADPEYAAWVRRYLSVEDECRNSSTATDSTLPALLESARTETLLNRAAGNPEQHTRNRVPARAQENESSEHEFLTILVTVGTVLVVLFISFHSRQR